VNWIPDAVIGDRFRWLDSGVICRITRFRDADIEVHFVYESGPQKGQPGYTIMPQDIEMLTVLDLIVLGLDP
jgi:hypothetical protein